MRKLGFVFLLCLAMVCFGRGPDFVDGTLNRWISQADSVWADSCGSTEECTEYLTTSDCNIVDVWHVMRDN